MAREDDILLTPELAAFLGEFGHSVAPGSRSNGRARLGQATGAGAEAQAIAVNVVQKGLNYLARINLRIDNDYGPSTAQALVAWIMTLPAAARQSYRIAPSSDRRWLYITPNVISQALAEAAARPARTRASPSPNTLSKMAQRVQNAYTEAAGFKVAIERYAAAHNNRVPANLRPAFVAWYRSVVAMQDVLVAHLRSDQTLISAINMRESGRYIVSQLATELERGRPVLPNSTIEDAPAVQAQLGQVPPQAAAVAVTGAFPPLIVLGIVIAVGIGVVLTATEVRKMVESANLLARLKAIIAALGGHITPEVVPRLPGGSASPEGRPRDEQEAPPLDWLKYLAWAAGLLVGGLVVYKIVDVYGEEQERKGAPGRNEHRRLRSGT